MNRYARPDDGRTTPAASRATLVDCTDADLVARVAAGEAAALATLYDRHAGVVFAVARRVLGETAAAEEVLQDVFFRVWQRAGAYQPERASFRTWVLTITHHMAIDEVRRQRRRPARAEGEAPEQVLATAPDPGPGVEAMAERGDLRMTLVEALARLPLPQRQAIELAYFGGLTQREVAAALGEPLGTIKTRLRLGLQKLNGDLSRLGQDAA